MARQMKVADCLNKQYADDSLCDTILCKLRV